MDSATLNSYVSAALRANGIKVSEDEKAKISEQFALVLTHADLIGNTELSALAEPRIERRR